MSVWWLPGFLALPSDPLPLPAQVLPLHALCQAGGLAALSRAVTSDDVLIGYSMGGRVALSAVTAGLRPAALVLLSASPGIADDAARAARRELDLARARALEADPAAFVAAWQHEPVFAGAEASPRWQAQQQARAALVADELAASGESLWARAQAEVLTAFSPGSMAPLWDALPHLPTPTLWIAGARDRAYVEAARAAAGRMPRAEVAVIPEAGHALPLEAPEALAPLLASFIAAHRRQTLSPTRAHNPTTEGEEAC